MNLNHEAKSYEVTQKSVSHTYQGMANLRLLNKVGDKTLMSGHTVSAQSLIGIDVSSKTQCFCEE